MTKASDNPFPSLLVQEAATDGSDFANPAVDYRRLFLGEDGLLHLKDSAGAVTDIGSGGGGSGTERPLVDPTGLSWSWVDQGAATITTYGASLELHDPANATDAWKLRVKAVPSKPYSILVHLKPLIMPVNYPGVGIGWLQTSDNHFAGIGQYSVSGDLRLNSFKSGTNYAITANYLELTQNPEHFEWMAISDDASNRRVWVSRNGHDWILFHSVATNDFITPDRVFFGCESRNATYDASVVVDSWEQTASSTP